MALQCFNARLGIKGAVSRMHKDFDDYFQTRELYSVRVSREPSQPQPIANASKKKKKTSSIYSRGMYSIPQHQSTLVFTRVAFGARPHADQKKKGEDAVPASSLFKGIKKKINKKITCTLPTGLCRRLKHTCRETKE